MPHRPKLKMLTVREQECLRCGHRWLPRVPEVRMCAKCKSAWFDTPRPKAAMKKTA